MLFGELSPGGQLGTRLPCRRTNLSARPMPRQLSGRVHYEQVPGERALFYIFFKKSRTIRGNFIWRMFARRPTLENEFPGVARILAQGQCHVNFPEEFTVNGSLANAPF